MKEIGNTKDSGFQVGARKTFHIEFEKAWDFMFSDGGLKIWLGDYEYRNMVSGEAGITKEGIQFLITTYKDHSHLRMKWKRADWDNASILQLRVIPAGEKTTIAFHQEKLLDGNQRQTMKNYWTNKIEQLSKSINQL